MRVKVDVPKLRRFELCKVLRRAFVYGCKKGEFRICQFSIQSNHLHLVCEAATAEARARGIQGFSVRVARGINGHCGRTGSVFHDRYHLQVLRSPTQVRNALCYVLQNARRHGVHLDPAFHGADPFSWLLRVGWQRAKAGLIALDEVPAAGRE